MGVATVVLRLKLARQIDLGARDVTVDVDSARHDDHARGIDAPRVGGNVGNDLAAIDADIADFAIDTVGRIMDPAEYGAVPLLGIDGLVFIGHGRSDARALLNAVKGARLAVERGLLPALREAIQTRLGSVAEVSL